MTDTKLELNVPKMIKMIATLESENGDLKTEIDQLRAEVERLQGGLSAVLSLIDESYGVAGLHSNGDIAPWSELRTGGRFEGWLIEFDEALKEPKP